LLFLLSLSSFQQEVTKVVIADKFRQEAYTRLYY